MTADGAARLAKGFAVAGQPDAAARKRAWKTRKARAKRSPNTCSASGMDNGLGVNNKEAK